MKRATFRSYAPEQVKGLGWVTQAQRSGLSDARVYAITAFVDGSPVAIGGYRSGIAGTCEGFLILSEEAKNYPAMFVQMRRLWPKITEDFRRKSIVAHVRDPKAISYAYHLGLQPEAVLRSAGPLGEDYLIFARVGPWQQ